MKTEGNFKYFVDGESKTIAEICGTDLSNMSCTVNGLELNYSSPKKEIEKRLKLAEQFNQEALENYNLETPLLKAVREHKKANRKIQELLKEADEHQKQNGGILKGVEFPFDTISNSTRNKFPKYEEGTVCNTFDNDKLNHILFLKEQKVIEDCNRKEFYIIPPSKENLDRMCDSFMDRVDNVKQKFTESGTKAGQKHNKLKAPLDILQTRQFSKALQLLALATAYGNHKYKDTDSDFLNFKRVEGGSQTYLDAQSRHATDRNNLDNESGLHHIIHSIWNGMAALEIWAEENKIDIEEYSKNYLKSLVVSK